MLDELPDLRPQPAGNAAAGHMRAAACQENTADMAGDGSERVEALQVRKFHFLPWQAEGSSILVPVCKDTELYVCM